MKWLMLMIAEQVKACRSSIGATLGAVVMAAERTGGACAPSLWTKTKQAATAPMVEM
jgi:hypothetical protein